MTVLWEITSQKVQKVIRKIVEVSQPRKLILFGSYVHGDMHLSSDLDILERAGIPLPQKIRDIGILTPYAVETRYPGVGRK